MSDNMSDTSDNSINKSEFDDQPVITAGKGLDPNGIFIPFTIISAVLTAAAALVGRLVYPITMGIPSNTVFRYTYMVIGIILLLAAIKLFVDVKINSDIDVAIATGKLKTDGIYRYSRHPLYFSILVMSAAILFIAGNTFTYIIPIILYIVLGKWLDKTEDAWLKEAFGSEYEDYKHRTHKIIPVPKDTGSK